MPWNRLIFIPAFGAGRNAADLPVQKISEHFKPSQGPATAFGGMINGMLTSHVESRSVPERLPVDLAALSAAPFTSGADGMAAVTDDDRPTGEGPRILVVDDNDDNRYTLTLYLELEGYTRVETAHDGEEAIARLGGGEEFDLVLLDVMMPKVDGYGVLNWLKDQAHLRDLPVIMISALNEVNSVVRCIELGAVDYLLKPFNPVLLKARLGATLEKKRLRDEIKAHLARLEEELEAARRLQMSMVPQHFPAPTVEFPLDLFASMEPAREVGGDLYDFFMTEDGMLCFLVGDVSGKGMPAALFMARAKSLIRITTDLMRSAKGAAVEPADIIARVNRELCQDNGDMMFVTLVLRHAGAGDRRARLLQCRPQRALSAQRGDDRARSRAPRASSSACGPMRPTPPGG